MKRMISLIFLCQSATILFAQRELQNPLVNSADIISKGVALHDKKEYKAAITAYLKVPVSYTNYATILHELYLSTYADSNYADAEKYALTSIDLFPEKSNEALGM